jgi:MFS transporter, DHA1 family, multidrug resistance protein
VTAQPYASTVGRPRDLRLFLVLGTLTVIGPASMDSYLPGLPALARDFGVGASAAQVTMTTFLIGLAIGQLVGGTLSDIHGRRRPIIGAMMLYAIVSFACAFAPNLYALAGMRALQGVLAAAGMAVSRAVVRDLYSGAAAARYLSRLILIAGLGPVLAPLVGAQILHFTSWRGVFVALAILGIGLAGLAWTTLPETLPPERRRARGLGATAQAYRVLLRDKRFVGLVLITGFAAGAVLGYLADSSFALEDVYGVSPQVFGALFGISGVCLILGAQVNAHLLRTRSPQSLMRFGLAVMLLAGVALVVLTPFPGLGVEAILPALALLMFSWSFIQSNALGLAMHDYARSAGTAAAIVGLAQYAFGAGVAPLVGIGGSRTAVPMAIDVVVNALAAAVAYIALVRKPGRPEFAGLAPIEHDALLG